MTPARFVVGLTFTLWLGIAAANDALRGNVLSVADGDTLTVRDGSGVTHRVRLVGIDAPERDQTHGREARDHLAEWVLGREVAIEHDKRDSFRRILGKVLLDGDDVNLRMVREGHAWHFKRYQSDQRWDDRWRYAWAQWRAQAERKGLWSTDGPVPPWEHRRQARSPGFRDAPATLPDGS